MGLSFHYSGTFKGSIPLSEMIEEVKDIAQVNQWKYIIYEKEFPEADLEKDKYNQKIYGISFSPPECEPVFLCFLSNGKMSSPPLLEMFGRSTKQDERKYLYMLSVKTHYAGIHVHKRIIDLLRYLNKKYFREMKVSDEGQYWETGDDEVLEKIFKRYYEVHDIVGSAFENNSRMPNESFEDYFQRILRQKGKK
ncbi:MAG: hypothetical protein WD824_03220 [Cyclobacteriaceae bacterium]